MPTVRDVMTSEPVTMDVNTVIVAVAKQMRDEAIGDVIVTEGDRICGIVTDRDITVRAVAADADTRATTIGDVVTRNPVTVAPDDDIKAAEGLMRTHAVKRLPVLDGDRIVGVVALGDIEVEEAPDSLEASIAAEDPNN
ncbi:CBS domain-containing protein [Planosporangium thailandense]|uniref:CBS domain-containing protein n=1 Tax=Planosporangium thailandense TaxID=765197 RepID=A0ABX0Y4F6_9ACTN|nr:CBS domain-containing protein [Planosporangium thailandense]NJC73291.1 CBS domain-containing protein [Planosporangium thailandense]